MNKLVGRRPNGTQYLLLLLEPGNLHRLQRKEPIAVEVHDMFPDGIPKKLDLYIYYSETPVADAKELEQNAEVALDARTHISKQKKPHCPECKSTVEQLGAWKSDAPVLLAFCPVCGCVMGALPPVPLTKQTPVQPVPMDKELSDVLTEIEVRARWLDAFTERARNEKNLDALMNLNALQARVLDALRMFTSDTEKLVNEG